MARPARLGIAGARGAGRVRARDSGEPRDVALRQAWAAVSSAAPPSLPRSQFETGSKRGRSATDLHRVPVRREPVAAARRGLAFALRRRHCPEARLPRSVSAGGDLSATGGDRRLQPGDVCRLATSESPGGTPGYVKDGVRSTRAYLADVIGAEE